MTEYKLSLPWPPSNNTYYRHGRGKNYISEKGEKYTKAVNSIIQQLNLAIKLSGSLSVTIYAAPPDNRKRDLDNLSKGVLDALTKAEFWIDDGHIDIHSTRRCQKIKGGQLWLVVRETDGVLPVITEIMGDT
ncbi:RusA family crossover junction endodeoxyribonuclease [Serratia fonticola]|uniref:RusA family crossover junction endodeoxyribonuclease n=1 Tax=Serratia fonticola TaxID=47917 RepID=UPI001644EE9C|nr:RusA family crossover junction endodeoxyribonuclease [Serratia fonticola]MBC3250470.1 RusA family crossover junction endodeoxyribonuclease [Serratia fonticola]